MSNSNNDVPLVGETVTLNLSTYNELNSKINFLSHVIDKFIFKTNVVISEDDTLVVDINKSDIINWVNELPNEALCADCNKRSKKIINIKDN